MAKFTQKNEEFLVDEAYKKIEELIVTAELKPGSIVSENELSEHLKIGRTPVREALKRMEPTSLIQILPRKGILIRVVSVDELLLQMEPRTALENLVMARAAKYASSEERQELLDLADQYERITTQWGPAIEALRIDDAFNRLVARACRNPFLAKCLLPLHPMARRQYYCNYFLDKDLTSKVNMSHVYLMRAISSGDIKKAQKCNLDLLENVRQFNSMSLSTWFPELSPVYGNPIAP